MGPMTRSLGWTRPLPHRPQAAKSLGPNRLGIAGTSVDADDLHAFADPIRRQVDAAGTPALGDDLLDHLLTENLELGLLAGARHAVNPPAANRRGGRIRLARRRLACSYETRRQESRWHPRIRPGRWPGQLGS